MRSFTRFARLPFFSLARLFFSLSRLFFAHLFLLVFVGKDHEDKRTSRVAVNFDTLNPPDRVDEELGVAPQGLYYGGPLLPEDVHAGNAGAADEGRRRSAEAVTGPAQPLVVDDLLVADRHATDAAEGVLQADGGDFYRVGQVVKVRDALPLLP